MDIWNEMGKWDEIRYFPLAYKIAQDAHNGQLRDEGTPYIEHIDGVIRILKEELHINSDMILAIAALHDVLEDSDKYTYEDIVKAFGMHIANGCKLLKHEKGVDVGLYLTAIDSCDDMPWLMKVKLADRLHNVRSLHLSNNKAKILRKCIETKDYYLDYAKKHSPYLYNEIVKALNSLESEG